MSIAFHSLIPKFSLKQKNKLREWLWTVAYLENKSIDRIDYIFCDDNYLLPLNKKFLKHKTLTDIITFDNSDGISLLGEIYISVERVRENAKKYSPSFEEELHRVMVHGVLHLCGYNDKTQKEKNLMRKKENQSLKLWHELTEMK